MANPNVQTCPVCGVKIQGGDKVIFSSGPVGTRARLWARVCNYAQKPACINQNQEDIGSVKENDYYKPLP
ncbi:hypothetical protein [Aphanothece sacrum]|uniref:Uncharacterized protein n=1 Tax=Aphanothece sacrum FPU1 TaxID=1920663 RepID=A0A401IMI7_APHSA|nr:hypothetical protein [Aphanothece sacrum]GBF82438.1 hypothetical protein AsFPU1_3867 [Aphanothece sacrum FPU1]GBF84407.1 hypothetical protein AsFPU3_1456 [Aphanothece sacrum FPU3]